MSVPMMPEYPGPRSFPGAPGVWFAEAWALFRARPGVWILAAFLPISAAFILTCTFAYILGSAQEEPAGTIRVTGSETISPWALLLTADLMLLPAYVFFQSLIASRVLTMTFTQMQGGMISAKEVFRRSPGLGRMVLVYCLCAVLILIGSLVCVVPGLLLSCVFLFASLFAADGAGVIGSIGMSYAAFKSHRVLVGQLGILVVFLWCIGLVFCGLGFLITQPLIWLVTSIAYRDLMSLKSIVPDYGAEQVNVWPPPPNITGV